MSQAKPSDFQWPAAPSVTLTNTESSAVRPSETFQTSCRISISHTPSATQASLSAVKTIRVTFIVHTPDPKISESSLIHQTEPLDLHAQRIPTTVESRPPDVTVASFPLYTPPVGSVFSTIPILSTHKPTPSPSSFQENTLNRSSAVSPAAIAGITLGAVTSLGILFALALCLHRCRIAKTRTNTKNMPAEQAIDAKMQRARDLGMQRWSMQQALANKGRLQALNPKKVATVGEEVAGDERKDIVLFVEDGDISAMQGTGAMPLYLDRARRPSGLAMHPPTPLVAQFEGSYRSEIGRAM